MTPADAGAIALITSPGPAAIATVRLTGAAGERFAARRIRTARAESWSVGQVRRGELLNEFGQAIDDVIAVCHGVCDSFELRVHLHGNPWLVRQVVAADPSGEAPAGGSPVWGEGDSFDRDAWAAAPRFLTRRGVAWLAEQPARLRGAEGRLAALSGEEARALRARIADNYEIVRWFTTPLRVALVGPPNAGKSTLINALTDQAVSLVSATPGTTRDWVSAPDEIDGFPVEWIDTAGVRSGADAVEAAGVSRTREIAALTDVVVQLIDLGVVGGGLGAAATAGAVGSDGGVSDAATTGATACAVGLDGVLAGAGGRAPDLVVLSKCDLVSREVVDAVAARVRRAARVSGDARVRVLECVALSGKTGEGVAEFRMEVLRAGGRDGARLDQPAALTPTAAASRRREPGNHPNSI